MSKRHLCFLSFLLFFSSLLTQALMAETNVGLKNLSWEEQKNKTRIILETTEKLAYNVVASSNDAEIQVELSNLDLRNLPQELFISTAEVVSLQTFPQTKDSSAKIIVKMTSVRPHHISTENNTLYIDVEGNPAGDGLLAPTTTSLPPNAEPVAPNPKVAELMKEAEKNAIPVEKLPLQETAANKPAAAPSVAPEVEKDEPSQETLSSASVVSEVRIQTEAADAAVVLVGDGSFTYDTFELSNPDRIVVDLKSVSISPGVNNVLSSDHELFSKVRLAQFKTSPKVARTVIDLNRKTPYRITQRANELRIALGVAPAATMDAPETPAAEMLPEETEEEEQVIADPVPAPALAGAPEIVPASAPKTAKADQDAKQKNEEFFSFEPDTSLFAQGSTGSTTSTTTTTETSVGGMGQLTEQTLRSGEKQYTGEPFSFDFKDIDIKDLFRFIADISGLNVILDPAVRGTVTLKLTEVPWDQALDLITKNQGLGYTIEGNVIRIAPVAKIAAEERDRATADKERMLSAPLVTKIKPLSYAKAGDVDRVIKKLLTVKGTSIIDDRTNTLIITDIDTNIDAIVNLVDILDSRTAQVVIEARIVETNKNYSQAFGIQWGFRGLVDPSFGNNTTLQFPNNILADGSVIAPTSGITGNPLNGYAVNLPTIQAPNSALLLSAGNILDTFRLDVALTALENTGNARVLSSPKIATQNNTRAEILQGTQIPVQTIANNTITTTYVNAALRMSVTPQITAEGTVILQVEVENNRPDFSNASTLTGTAPIITERAVTTLLVEDGGTTVIGGIFTATDSYAQGRTPVLHRIPLLGWLFKNTNVSRTNRELLIFLTPRIMR